jgi:hypothetical protein
MMLEAAPFGLLFSSNVNAFMKREIPAIQGYASIKAPIQEKTLAHQLRKD